MTRKPEGPGGWLYRQLSGPPLSGPESYVLTRRLWLVLLGGAFFVAFATLWPQVNALFGAGGILPVARFLPAVRAHEGAVRGFYLYPSIFHFAAANWTIHLVFAVGTLGSVALMAGLAPRALLALLWALYLSVCIAGGIFLDYQWDTLLLEVAFLTIFWAPSGLRPGPVRTPRTGPLILLRFLLFRLMFLGGLVKLIGESGQWTRLTALDHHYATQPYPTVIAYYLHHLPAVFHAATAVATLVIELVAPLFFFGPRRARIGAAMATIFLQAMITLTGSFGFFNMLTACLCVVLVDDEALLALSPLRLVAGLRQRTHALPPNPQPWRRLPFVAYASVVAMNSVSGLVIRVGKGGEGLPSPLAWMLTYTERFRTVNVYGLFEDVATRRYELFLEGSRDGATWRPYARRHAVDRPERPLMGFAPFDPRVEFQLWSVALGKCEDSPWFLLLQQRLLEGSPVVAGIFADNPFVGAPPTYVRSSRRPVTFTTLDERDRTGAWWVLGATEPFCRPLRLDGGRLVNAAP